MYLRSDSHSTSISSIHSPYSLLPTPTPYPLLPTPYSLLALLVVLTLLNRLKSRLENHDQDRVP